MLGFGLLSVFSSGRVEVLVEAVAWRPRFNAKRRSRILEEHLRRRGDPATGGGTRRPIMTAYRSRRCNAPERWRTRPPVHAI